MFKLAATMQGIATTQDAGAPADPPVTSIEDLYANNEGGLWIDPSDNTKVFTDLGGSVQANYGEQVKRVTDKSGNGNHVFQHNSGAYPYYGREAKDTALTNRIFGNNQIRTTQGSTDYGLDYFQVFHATITQDQLTPPVSHGGTVIKVVENNTQNFASITCHSVLSPATNFAVSFYIKEYAGDSDSFAVNCGTSTVVTDWDNTSTTTTGTEITSVSVTSLSNGWLKFEAVVNWSNNSGGTPLIYLQKNGNPYGNTGGTGFYIYAIQANLGTTHQEHQVTGANIYDYTQYNKDTLYYLNFQTGSGMGNNTVNLGTSVDAVTIFASVRFENQTDANIIERTDSIADNNGAFRLFADTSEDKIKMVSKGTVARTASKARGTTPVKKMITGIADISDDSVSISVDGATANANAGDQSAGTFAQDTSLNVGCRNYDTTPVVNSLGGKIYQLVVTGQKMTNATSIDNINTLVAAKAGLTV